MIRRFLLGVLAFLLIFSLATPVVAQTSGSPTVTLTHSYVINEFGFGILNDTFTFLNNGTSTSQVPSFQLGIPDAVASHAVAFAVSPSTGFSESRADNGTLTTVTVTPSSPSLGGGATSTVSVETYLTGVLNITAASSKPFGALLLLSPAVNLKVNVLNLIVEIPTSGTLTPTPAGFISSPTSTPPTFSLTKTNVTPTVSTVWSKLTIATQQYFFPVQVTSLVRTIIPGVSAYPQIQDQITLRNLASYSISQLPLTLLAGAGSQVTIVPSSSPPTSNPTSVSLTGGAISLTTAPFTSAIQAGDNFTFTMVYSVPGAFVKTSGATVSVSVPYELPIDAAVGTYTVTTQLGSGIHSVGTSQTVVTDATPINQGSIDVTYTVSTAWAADQAVPAASLVFAAVFIAVAVRRPKSEEKEETDEEDETLSDMLPDLIKGLEDKISLFVQFQTEIAGKVQGAESRADLSKIRTEIESLKTRSVNRLNEIRQTAGSKRFLDLVNQIGDAEREEDRTAKDLLNLYDQFHSRRMREETYRRLLPSYRKRWDASTDHLSDLLNMAQREGKHA